MKDRNGKVIEIGDYIKYSYNDFGIPLFTGMVISQDSELFVEHSNKVKVKLNDSMQYIEVVKKQEKN